MAIDDWKKKNDFVLGKKKGIQKIRRDRDDASPVQDEESVTRELRQVMDEIEPLIEQVNNLYQKYIAGVDQIPPLGRRGHLDRLIKKMTQLTKTTVALKYRYDTIHSRYISFRDRWDKMMRDLEAGKIGRRKQKKFFT